MAENWINLPDGIKNALRRDYLQAGLSSVNTNADAWRKQQYARILQRPLIMSDVNAYLNIQRQAKQSAQENLQRQVWQQDYINSLQKADSVPVQHLEKGKPVKKNVDISNITDEEVANLPLDRSMLGGDNTMLSLSSNHGYPTITLSGDSISTEDGSKWRVTYDGGPGINHEGPGFFTRHAVEYDDDGNRTGRREERSFTYNYPSINGHNLAADAGYDNHGTYTYANNEEQKSQFKTPGSHYMWTFKNKSGYVPPMRRKQGGLLMRKGGRIVEVPYYQGGTNGGVYNLEPQQQL